MSHLDRVANLVQNALNEFDNPEMTVGTLCRRAIRIARLRNDFESLWWLLMEVEAIGDRQAKLRRVKELAPHFTREKWEQLKVEIPRAFIEERSYVVDTPTTGIESGSVYGGTVDELESKIAMLLRHAEEAVPPPGMHPVDLYFTEQEKSKLRFDLTMSAEVHRAILFRVRQRIYTFLSETEQALAYGHANADIFERNRHYVDERIRFVAPGVLDQFAASYRRMGEEDEEARSQALLSCRRILKSVADLLYPPPEEPVIGLDGKKRQLTSDQFIARLWQFVYERIRGHSSGELLMASVHSVGHRLDQLNNLSSKGVHAVVTDDEVEQCIIQTYLVVGDLLRLAEGASGLQGRGN